MSCWHMHSDKWPNLCRVQYGPQKQAMEAFNPAAAYPAEEKAEATLAIARAIDEKPKSYLVGETLHASNLVFIEEALKPENAEIHIDALIEKSFSLTNDSSVSFFTDLRKTILAKAFRAARTEDEGIREHSIKIFDALAKLSPDLAKRIIEDHLPIDEDWQEGSSIAPIVRALNTL